MAKPPTVTTVRGFRDILPEDTSRWARLEAAAARVFGDYGFGEIRLPIVERLDLFVRPLGETTDVVEKEMFSFEDRDGTVVTLRPEATASVVRAFIETGLVHRDPTARLWYGGPMFRRERPQKGRFRQFYQLGAEVFGRADPVVDAELLVMMMQYLDEAGADGIELELNSLGDAVCRPVFRERLQAFGRAHLAELCPDCHRRIERNPLRLLDCKVEACRAVMANAPRVEESLCEACREHFGTVRSLLDRTGVAYRVNGRLVRGFDYYCRTAFEVVSTGLGSQNAVGGGGRYDGLVAALGGPDVPGIGFAIGLDRLAMIVRDAEAPRGPLAVVLPLGDAAAATALELATRLRRAGVAVGLEGPGKSMKALLRAADRQGARLAIILGEDELQAGRATLRDLVRRTDHPRALALDASGAELAASIAEAIGVAD